jgi:hypothetical protein
MNMEETLRAVDARLADPLAALAGGIGFVGADVPIDVMLASGRPFGHLPWRTSGTTRWADAWLESSFPFWARSILQQWHEGAFDALDTVVFSRAEDASQRLYYYVRELQRRRVLRGPAVHAFDIAFLARASSVAHSTGAVAALATAIDAPRTRLAAGIERANELRAALAAIERGRAADGSFYERLGRAALWNNPAPWLRETATRPSAAARGPRILLAGSVPPDDRLHRAVEAGGAHVVAETHVHRLGRLGAVLAVEGEAPERAIARHAMSSSVGPRAVLDRGAWLVGEAAAARAAAVILWLTREDEALAWHVPAERRALAAAGLPTLMLTAARWQADDGALERAAQFCQEVSRATA